MLASRNAAKQQQQVVRAGRARSCPARRAAAAPTNSVSRRCPASASTRQRQSDRATATSTIARVAWVRRVDGVAGAEHDLVGLGWPRPRWRRARQHGRGRASSRTQPLPAPRAATRPSSSAERRRPEQQAAPGAASRGSRSSPFLTVMTGDQLQRARGTPARSTSSRNRGSTPITVASASSGTIATASRARRSANGRGVPGASGQRSRSEEQLLQRAQEQRRR